MRCSRKISLLRVRVRTSIFRNNQVLSWLPAYAGLNCICFKCKRSLIEIVENRGRVLTGCVNCNIWWKASGGPVREYDSQETLRVLTQALTGTAVR